MPLLTMLLRLCAAAAFARAGGGGSFHSSGGSYHSSGGSYHSSGGYSSSGHYSSGGDDGLFFLLQSWIVFSTSHPLLGLILNALLLYAVYRIYTAGDDWRYSSVISSGLEAQGSQAMAANLDALRRRDPAFAGDAFLQRAGAGFLAIQAAWSKMDMTPARALISDGVMERFTVQLAMLKAQGLRNDMSEVSVTATEILQIESSAFWDVIHARIEASAVDRDLSLSDGSVARDGGSASFEEVWTFARRPSAKTLAGRGALEGACPNCGAALQLLDGEQCAACKSWLNSGEFDWVLCEITQASEWSARDASRDAPGYAALSAKDPALNARFLEDRASVSFWRMQEALWSGGSKPLRPVAAEAYCAAVDRDEAAGRYYYRDAAIGAVIALAFETGGPRDRAHLVVRWSGERCETDGGAERRLGSSYMETVMILERNAGVLTDSRSGLRSLRCPACGAPPTSRETAACEYCARPFNDGSMHWVLADAVPAADWKMPFGMSSEPGTTPRSQPPRDAQPSEAPAPAGAAAGAAAVADAAGSEYAWAGALSADAALRVMAVAMMADGKIAPEEQQYLVGFARSHGVGPETVSALVEAAEAGRLELPKPNNALDSCAFLRGLIVMSLADGKISPEEGRAITACAESLSMSSTEVAELIERERARLYAEAKAALARRRAQP